LITEKDYAQATIKEAQELAKRHHLEKTGAGERDDLGDDMSNFNLTRFFEEHRLMDTPEYRATRRQLENQRLQKTQQEKARLEFDQENAFMSRAKAPRFVAGEPVASGVQPSKLTSAIRSQMISSTTGVLGGVKAGTSKEIHGLQRQVLQKNSTPAVSDLSSRRLAEMSHDSNTFIRSTSVCRPSARGKLDMNDEDGSAAVRGAKLRRTESAPAPPMEKQKKRDLKPGYCENCADKFDDFDEVCSHDSLSAHGTCD
jgi:regulatory subunit for Cdc7p protein kinase